jgi:predicted ATP-dependent serine protease
MRDPDGTSRAQPTGRADDARLVSTGNPGADVVLGGGFPRNSINIIMGAPGTGKTLLAQQLALHNGGQKRPVLYLTTLSEPLSKVITSLEATDRLRRSISVRKLRNSAHDLGDP